MNQCCFGRRINRAARKDADRLHGRNEHDCSVLIPGGGCEIPRQKDGSGEIDSHGIDELGFAGGFNRNPGRRSHQRHQAIQVTRALRLVDQANPDIRFQDVTGDNRRHHTVFFGNLAGERVGPLAVAPASDDRNGSSPGQGFSDRGAESSGPSGKNDGLSLHFCNNLRRLI